MHFLVLQHLAIEAPALIGDVLQATGHRLSTVQLDQGDTLPETAGYDGIVIMGGPQSANDADMQSELNWIATALTDGMPMIGICLGAQLMAKAAGASIMPAPKRELGWFPVYPTRVASADPLFQTMPDPLVVFQWHGESFSLTDDMTLLATHPDVPAQVFRLKQGQYGLQCHIEVDSAIIEAWIAYGASERKALGDAGIKALQRASESHLKAMQAFGRAMVGQWLCCIEKVS